MSDRLDELARTLARPMPRVGALRLLGRALAVAAVPGGLAGAACAATGRATACTGCGVPHGAGCVLNKTCGSRDMKGFPVCCKWPGYFGRFEYGPAGGMCAQAGGNGLSPPGGLACCCPAGTTCGGPPGPPCVPDCDGEKCGRECCKDPKVCKRQGANRLCCLPEEDACFVAPAPGMPTSGVGKGVCCPRGTTCRRTDTVARCCGPDQSFSKGACVCPKGKPKCGTDCCDAASKETCSNGKCCPKGTVNCGRKGTCCDQIDCCDGTCCKGDAVCTNGTCCPPDRGFGSGKSARCCPRGTAPVKLGAGRFGCCPPGIPNCCDDDQELACLPGTVCVSGACRRL